MQLLSNEELKNIKADGLGLLALIGVGIVFLIGVVDGYVRPLKCN